MGASHSGEVVLTRQHVCGHTNPRQSVEGDLTSTPLVSSTVRTLEIVKIDVYDKFT